MLRQSGIAAALGVAFLAAACNGNDRTDDAAVDEPRPDESAQEEDGEIRAQDKEVTLQDSEGNGIGTVTLIDEGEEGVRLDLNLRNLPPGEHAIHFHEDARCEPPDFESSGGHFNPDERAHGFEDPEGHHVGDIPNIEVDEDSTARGEVIAPRARMDESEFSVLENRGTALVIHAGADDYVTDPAGDAGDRIACGEVTRGS